MNAPRNSHHDDLVELNGGRDLDAGENATSLAVRAALIDDAGWTAERTHVVTSAASARAGRRRRQRLLKTTVGLMGSAAVVATVAFSGQNFLPWSNAHQFAAASPAASPKASRQVETDVTLATPSEVQAIIPGAQLLDAPINESRDIALDACGTGELAGIPRPLSTKSESWVGRQDGADLPRGSDAGQAHSAGLLMTTMDSYSDPDEAAVYATALERSIGSCTPKRGSDAPAYPFNVMVRLASVLYVSDYADGLLDVTVVQVSGRHVVTVNALLPVPAAADAAASPKPDQQIAPISGADRKSADTAVMATVDLSTFVARRVTG